MTLRSAASTVVVFLALVSPVYALPAGHAFYEGDDPPTAKVKALDDAKLTSVLKAQVKARGVTVKNLATGAEGLEGLSQEVRQGLLMGISSPPGAEVDVWVEGPGGWLPMEVWLDAGALTYRVGTPREQLYGPAPTKEALQKKYGVGAFIDDGSTWDDAMLSVVDTALARLSPAELAVLAGMPFHRMPKDPSGKATRGAAVAMYRQEGAVARIELYDSAVDSDRRKFVGSADAPVPQSVSWLLHEVMHAIAKRSTKTAVEDVGTARAALEAATNAFNEGQKKYNEDRATYAKTRDPELRKSLEERAKATPGEVAKVKALQKHWQDLQSGAQSQALSVTGLEQAFNAKFPPGDSPTPYGRTLPGENLAECFRLWKLDPAALERAEPGVSAWFTSPAYLEALPAAGKP